MSSNLRFYDCTIFVLLALLICEFVSMPAVANDVVIENKRVRLVIDSNGKWREIIDKESARNYCYTGRPVTFCRIAMGKKVYPAVSLIRQGNELRVKFRDTNLSATYRVEETDNWITLELESVRGEPSAPMPDWIEFVSVPVAITENIGTKLNIAWNEQYAICMLALNLKTDCRGRGGKYARLTARAWHRFGFNGPKVALITCPRTEIEKLIHKVEVVFNLPRNEKDGVAVKYLPRSRRSYLFITRMGEQDIDKVIAYAKAGGFGQIMLTQTCWSKTTGHYLFNKRRFPNGKEGIKKVVDRFHDAGFLAGMHIWVSKVSKSDPYVTPIPDPRIWKDRTVTLAEDIDANQTVIRMSQSVSDWPGGLAKRRYEGIEKVHCDVIIDDEIIHYEKAGPKSQPNCFVNCQRGAYGTNAAPHKAGTRAYHPGIDGCIRGYIIDQETTLLDEVASNAADIFNYCGFDMVYFDGGEDIPRPHYWHYSSKFQLAALNKFKKRPIIHQGTIMTHFLWHTFSRTATVDIRTTNVKAHIDNSVRRVIDCHRNLIPGELGWFGLWPKSPTNDGLQFDQIEYLLVKSLAYDAPISIETSLDNMDRHILTPQILEMIRTYEELRIANAFSEEERERLRPLGVNFALIRDGDKWKFAQVEEVPHVGGKRDVRAFVGELGDSSVATLWHHWKEGEITLRIPPSRARLIDFLGKEVKFSTTDDGTGINIPVTTRRYALLCRGVSKSDLRRTLEEADVSGAAARQIWIQAEKFKHCVGEMSLGSKVNLKDGGAMGDFIICTGKPSPANPREWYCEYTVKVPYRATWAVWGRFKFPSMSGDSFGFVPKGVKLTLDHTQVFGNSAMAKGAWHWDSASSGDASKPGSRVRTMVIDKGPFTFRIYAREGPGTLERNPRLDMICLTDDPGYVPNDEDARKSLK